jgi:thiol-disulfide isomerase/thioredoxin
MLMSQLRSLDILLVIHFLFSVITVYVAAAVGSPVGVAEEEAKREARREEFESQGETWRRLGHYESAESAYLDAWRLGSKPALEALRQLYIRRKGSEQGFWIYLDAVAVADVQAAGTERSTVGRSGPPGGERIAPLFEAVSLAGESYALEKLRGQVVVLNFWFIGCLPCRTEIPLLNQLVETYGGRDVVFLAFANDATEPLRGFLHDYPFRYVVLPDSELLARAYGIYGYPTHVVIDREGRITADLAGSSLRLEAILGGYIETALGEEADTEQP